MVTYLGANGQCKYRRDADADLFEGQRLFEGHLDSKRLELQSAELLDDWPHKGAAAVHVKQQVLVLAAAFLGVIIAVLAISESVLLTAFVLLLSGLPQAARQTLSNVLVQSYSSDEYRGRVSSLYMMEFGFTMFGVFLFGQLADLIGIRTGLFLTAVALLIVCLTLLRSKVSKLD